MRRRDFCLSLPLAVAAGAAAWPACARSERLRLLILGGTNFVGPHLVHSALAAGHEVTLFNRGVTNPDLFPQLETLTGNRYPDRDAGLAALEGDRRWDAVIDTWQEAPGCVDVAARMLADRVRRYVYVSSIATYRNFRAVGMTEEGPLRESAEHVASLDPDLPYPVRKRAGEQAVERVFGDRGTVLRCTSIQGPQEGSAASSVDVPYWPYRFLAEPVLLAPDDPAAYFQLIDVRDAADFAIRTVERELGGPYNVVGPETPLLLRDYLEAWSDATDARARIVWVDPSWLLERDVRPFDDIQYWIPADDPEPGFYRISNRKALGDGLTYRPLQDTISGSIASIGDPELLVPMAAGLTRERELELIASWQAAAADGR